MACTECRNFSGSPVCGACRAASRVVNILKSGRLPPAEERRVTGLIRGLAGELSDLLEAHLLIGQPAPPRVREEQGGTPAPTPGAEKGVEVKKEPPSDSEYTYTGDEDNQEVEADKEDTKEESPEVGGAGDKGPKAGEKEEQGTKEAEAEIKEESKGEEKSKWVRPPLNPNFQRDYLTRRIGLSPCPKAGGKKTSPGGDRKRENRSPEHRRDHGGSDQRERSRGRERVEARAHSPDRPPLQRRQVQPRDGPKRKKKKHKNPNRSKGVKRRERGREFRAWREEDRQRRGGQR